MLAIFRIQKWMKNMHARKISNNFISDLINLKKMRELKKIWQLRKQNFQAIHNYDYNLVLWNVILRKEIERASQEIKKEKENFKTSWKIWKKRVLEQAMQKPLAKKFVTQFDPKIKQTYYIDILSGAIQYEHPSK